MDKNINFMCAKCKCKTKRPTGFWDGVDDKGHQIGGPTYECDSPRCPIARSRRKAAKEAAEKKEAAQAENRKNGIDPTRIILLRRQKGATLGKLAGLIGCTPAELSAWENGRSHFPEEQFWAAMRALAKLEDMAAYADKPAGYFFTSEAGRKYHEQRQRREQEAAAYNARWRERQARFRAKAQEKARRNIARLKGCPLHEFDWRGAIEAEKARRKAREEKYGVTLNIHTPVFCRCKRCGGKMLVEFAAVYMEAAEAAAGKEGAGHE